MKQFLLTTVVCLSVVISQFCTTEQNDRINIYSAPESIVVENVPAGETIHIYNVLGTLVSKTQGSEHSTILMPQGIYVVKVGQTTRKVVVNQ